MRWAPKTSRQGRKYRVGTGFELNPTGSALPGCTGLRGRKSLNMRFPGISLALRSRGRRTSFWAIFRAFLRGAEQGESDDGLAVVADLCEQTGLRSMRDGHFGGCDFLLSGGGEAKLAIAEGFLAAGADGADGGTEDAAGHGTPGVDAAAAGGWIERGTGRFVGEILEAVAVAVCCAQHAGGRVAGKCGAVLGNPGAGAGLDGAGGLRVCKKERFHARAEAPCVEGIDGESAVAALGAADAAGEVRPGAMRGGGEVGVDDLDELEIAGRQRHEGSIQEARSYGIYRIHRDCLEPGCVAFS